jgi:hypothetical protein
LPRTSIERLGPLAPQGTMRAIPKDISTHEATQN